MSRNSIIKYLLAFIVFIAGIIAQAQPTISISGTVVDSKTGEKLVGVTIMETKFMRGVTTNGNGFYSISVPSGEWSLQASYIGYQTQNKRGGAQNNVTLNFELEQTDMKLSEVVVEARRNDENVRAPEMGIVKLDIKEIKVIPSFLGEVDVVKALQLMPGVQATSEGSTGFSVRGGGSDQNLILLDNATVYNSGHMLGFFSIFNNDAVKNVMLYKGDIPAAYGGRLSSLLDVEMKEGDRLKHSVLGSIGTISSKFTVDGPIIKDRTTFLVAGRRTYADLFLPFANDENLHDNKLFFWDVNLKLSHVINENNRLYFTGYSGSDVFGNDDAKFDFGNTTGSLKWNHNFSRDLFMNLSLIYSRYSYNLGTSEDEELWITWASRLTDIQPRIDFTHYINEKHKLKYGASLIYHNFFPGEINGGGSTIGNVYFNIPSAYALESGFFADDEFKISYNLTLKYGLRFSLFQNVGPGTSYIYDDNYIPMDSITHRSGNIYNTYSGLEPRLAFTWLLNELSSIKGSYSHTVQFITLAQNSSSGTPLNIWFPASPNIKPQLCDQYSAGYFRNFLSNMYEVSGEAYYKTFSRLIDFRDHAELFLNKNIEGEVRKGRGYSYGFEALLRKTKGAFTGWLGYTYSRSFRIVPEINKGKRYPALYDKPHTINIVASYAPKRRLSFSASWTYSTGLPITLPTGRAVIGSSILPVYSDRNSYRMEDYHRLDASVTLKNKTKPDRKWNSELNLSIYNLYNRHNMWAISFPQEEDNPNIIYAEKTYLFAVVPALTFNFNF